MKKGDKVFVLDDDISGIILSISGTNVVINSTDDFEMEFDVSELILADSSVSKKDFVNALTLYSFLAKVSYLLGTITYL